MKKIILLSLLAFIVSNFKVFSQEQLFKQKTLVIKIKSGTDLEIKWFKNDRNIIINDFTSILGNHQATPYFSTSVLKAYQRSLNRTKYRSLNIINNNLSRICIVKYSANINPVLAAAKIKSNPEIEYAEPMPIHRINYIPNDPDISLQYYLDNVKVFQAWDYVDTNNSIIVGIVDTGIDYLHPDLEENIFHNVGEIGKDNDGKDKKSNGIDDDNNGFVDDWNGWDFVGSNGQDNDPKPGHLHGTHVAGTIGAIVNNGLGISGVVNKVKLLAVKIGEDNPYSTSVDNSYEGILYAASMGAKVINCSWGSSVKSEAEQETIDAVLKLGSVVVAAAGNSNQDIAYYPAAHNGVVSVAAVDWSDRRAYFSNYNFSVDVSAPGVGIYATTPDKSYQFLDGTSMASPIVSGVVALIIMNNPEYFPLQIIEHLKATTDNIDTLNPTLKSKLGTGRVNALNAVNAKNIRSITIKDYLIKDENNDGVFDAGEKVELYLQVLNVLSAVKESSVVANTTSSYDFKFINDKLDIGDLETLEEKNLINPIIFTIPEDIPTNYILTINLDFSDINGYSNSGSVSMTLKPTYRTLDKNNITVTFNSIGNIAFNDYPDNSQGDGFKYKNSSNLLFEGALMIGLNNKKVSNVARGEEAMQQDKSFIATKSFLLKEPGILATLEGSTLFTDGNGNTDVGAEVAEKVYQYNQDGKQDFVIVQFDIINITNDLFDSLFVGLYFDWDIGPSGSNNQAFFDEMYHFGYMKNNVNPTLPWVGVALLSKQKLNYFALDNDGETEDNPGVYGGFTISEKWQTLSSGLTRLTSSVTDASNIISAGPVKLNSKDTTRIVFSLFSGMNLDELRNAYNSSLETYIQTGFIETNSSQDSFIKIIPNPAGDYIEISFNSALLNINDIANDRIIIYNSLGEIVIVSEMNQIQINDKINISHLPIGFYLIRIGEYSKTFLKI